MKHYLPRRILPLVLAIYGAVSLAAARNDSPSLDELIKYSDMIVVGTFDPATMDSTVRDSADGMVYRGALAVEEILWGDQIGFLLGRAVDHAPLAIEWRSGSGDGGECDPRAHAGEKGIWFLTRTASGGYQAGRGRFFDTRQRRRIVRLLRKGMVLLRSKPGGSASSAEVTLVLRNARRQDAEVPDFSMEAGRLRLHPGVRLTVHALTPAGKPRREALPGREGRFLALDPEDWTVVMAGEERVAAVNLTELFDLQAGSRYLVTFQIEGYGKDTATVSIP